VYSAVFDDGDNKAEPEWPPHPSRLFSALTAAWGDSGAEEDLRAALEWLEEQPAPRIFAGGISRRERVQAFVPVNDSESLPEDRPRKGRVFPSGTLIHPDVYFIWDAAPDTEILSRLDQILLRTSSLGHSSSMVSVEIADAVETGHLAEWVPYAPKGDRMRIPYPGRLQELVEQYRKFERDGNKVHRLGAGRTTLYATSEVQRAEPARGIFDRMIILKRDVGPRASLRSALSVMSALRGAMLAQGPQPPPEVLSGHAPGSTPTQPIRSERPHAALIPLPFVGAPHADGDLKGVAVLLPGNLTREERDICWRTASTMEELKMPWGIWRVSMTDAEEGRQALQPRTWMRPRKVWSTVTPFVFDRYPKDPYGPEAEAVVREAFRRVGLPEPSGIDLHYNPWHAGVPKASAFPAAAARPGKPQRYHCHVRVRFEELVAGPLVAGAGRFYGYGLFRGHDRDDIR
jgi:CRISPR-associated protein Csb2